MRKLKPNQGGILPYALIVVATLAMALSVLLSLQQARMQSLDILRQQKEADLLLSSASAAVEGALLQAIRSGDLSQAPSLAAGAVSRLSADHWTNLTLASSWTAGPDFDGIATPGMSAVPFARVAPLAPLDPPPPAMAWLDDMPVRRSRFTIATSLAGVATPNNPSPTLLTSSLVATIIEVPTVNFAFVATSRPFEEAGSRTSVAVQGYALFNAGVSRPSGANPTVSSGSLILGGSVADNVANLNAVPFNSHTQGTWGLGSWADFTSPSAGGPNTAEVSRAYASIGGGITVEWRYPSITPAGMPFGVSYAPNLAGKARVVVDLSRFDTSRHLYINCSSDDTKQCGVVVVGEPNSSPRATQSLSITTNGQVTLMGDNVRPVFVSSNYSSVVQLLSSAYRRNPVGGSSSGMSWRGYLHISKADVVYSSPAEDWSNATLTINGTFAYQGGTINGIRSLVLTRAEVVRSGFAQTSQTDPSIPISDRIALITVTPR